LSNASALPNPLLIAGFLFDAIDYLTYYSSDNASILFSLKDWIMFLGEEGIGLLYNVAEEVSYYGFRSFLDQYTRIKTIKSKLEFASTIYQNCGLGILHFKKAGPRGGRIVSPSSHHVTGWLAKHGRRDTPGCHFARGWIAGVMEVIYNRPLKHFTVEEQHCKMKRDEECVFHVRES
jgi:predicted hydrocarbon binding protein